MWMGKNKKRDEGGNKPNIPSAGKGLRDKSPGKGGQKWSNWRPGAEEQERKQTKRQVWHGEKLREKKGEEQCKGKK